MRECLICGARKHVQSCEKIQLCTRCAGVLWDVLRPKLHPKAAEKTEEVKNNGSSSKKV